jgi:hypothetical protein
LSIQKAFQVLLFRSTTELSTAIPSWVVDWSNTDHLIHMMLHTHVPTGSTITTVRIGFSNDSRVLSLYGLVIDTVEHVSLAPSRKFDYKLERVSMGMPKYLSSFEGTMDIVIIRHWIILVIGALQRQFNAWLRMIASDIPLAGYSLETLDAAWQRKLPPGFGNGLRSISFQPPEDLS